MTGFGSLLVPLDFSELAGSVVAIARRVLAPGGSVCLLHVVEWVSPVTEGTFGIYPNRKDIEKYRRQAEEKLRAHEKDFPGAALHVDVREGRPATCILEAIGERQPGAVVMGTHGRGRLDHLLLGSVAERVLRKATCPVVTVPFLR